MRLHSHLYRSSICWVLCYLDLNFLSFLYLDFICCIIFMAGTENPNSKSKVDSIDSSLKTVNLTSSSPVIKPKFDASGACPVKSFSFIELKNATRNFRSESLLGEGGFGCVFKGWIDEQSYLPTKPGTGIVVAVKKLKPGSLQGYKEWLVRKL